MTDISNKQTKKYLDDDGTGAKPKKISQRGMRYTPSYDPIHQFWDRDMKIEGDDFGRKIK